MNDKKIYCMFCTHVGPKKEYPNSLAVHTLCMSENKRDFYGNRISDSICDFKNAKNDCADYNEVPPILKLIKELQCL